MNTNLYLNRYETTLSGPIGSRFWKLMLAWNGSIFKLVWLQLTVFLFLFSALNLLYKHVFMYNDTQREVFELICIYCSRFSSKIPVTFMTSFYVANVISRYWDQFLSLPWPDRFAIKLVSYVPGQDDYSRSLRRTVMRYINLSTVLVFRLVSPKVCARFPTYSSLVDAGIMLPGEDALIAEIDARTSHETTWVPISWAANLLQSERAAGRFKIEGTVYVNLVSAFEYIQNSNRRIFNHGWVAFPFAYTQLITLTVYAYLFSNLFGHQFLEPRDSTKNSTLFQNIGVQFTIERPYDLHTPIVEIPVFSIIEFIAYLGWIKVAETLLHPWGDDDEDFQINYLIDRNFQTSFLIVDEALTPIFVGPDAFTNKIVPSELPYFKTKKLSSKLGRKISSMRQPQIATVNQSRNPKESRMSELGTDITEKKFKPNQTPTWMSRLAY